jgi:phospholipase C
MNRRGFVASAAAVAGAAGLSGVLPASLAKAATRSARDFDLSKVKHLVFQMQENRSFDHYFGTFPGAGIQRPHRHQAAQRPAGLPAARPGQPRRLP